MRPWNANLRTASPVRAFSVTFVLRGDAVPRTTVTRPIFSADTLELAQARPKVDGETLEALFERDARLELDEVFGFGNIGLTLPRVVGWQRSKLER